MLFLQSVGSSQRAIIVTGIAAAALAGAPALSHADEVDAGSLQQQIERNQSPKLPPVSAPLPARQPLAQQPRVGGLVTLKQFRFTGNSKLSEQALNAALAQYLGQSLSFSQLESAVLDVSEAYREAGWVVRAFLPEQDVVDGIVLIQIVEAVLGEVLINDTVPGSAPASTLKKIIQTQQAAGQLLSATALDRALLNADDISGAYVSGSLQEGQKDGQTDLVLKLQGKPAIDGSLKTDNTG